MLSGYLMLLILDERLLLLQEIISAMLLRKELTEIPYLLIFRK